MAEGSNQLAGSCSPFLQHGAHQPVHWMPWSTAAFDRARETDRPILLDIGAVWCHWCHVMDRESYENIETAALINEWFVPVKVDRDERPDVDARYQRAVQLLTGGGGWPLTAFLTHDGTVFYGGTYFPPEDGHGRPSLQSVLREVSRVWTTERARAIEAASGIEERLATYARAESEQGTPDASLIDAAAEELATTYDFRYGGFGGAPKFPHAGGLDLLIDYSIDNNVDWARRIVEETLEAMARGGIYDQIGGGFHRYATDARWLIPHFEKMAYDNGALLTTFARAAAAYDNDSFRAVARGITAHYAGISPWLLERGGFPASQDADHSADDDGDYWTWTSAEIRDALTEDQARAAILYFGVEDRASAMHVDPRRHVLFRAGSIDSVAREMGIAGPDAERIIADAAKQLKAVRDSRARPFVDETQYTSWTALVASGHLAAARWVGDTGAKQSAEREQHAHLAAMAQRALERMHTEAFREGRGLLHRFGDESSGYVLDDQAQAAVAYLDAFEVLRDDVWLQRANQLLATMDAQFRDDSGAFRDRPRDADVIARPLAAPQMSITDSPTPSGNGSAALALFRYAAITGDEVRADRGREVLHAFGKAAARFNSAAATYLHALAWDTRPVTKIVIVGDRGTDAGRDLYDVALRTYVPRMALRWIDATAATIARNATVATGTTAAAGLPPEIAAMLTNEFPRAYVCVGHTCSAPIADVTRLATVLSRSTGST